MSNYEKFIKLLIYGQLTTAVTMAAVSAYLLKTLDFKVLFALVFFSFIFSFIPVLFAALVRAFLISKMKNQNVKLLVTILFGLLMGSIGSLLYPIVVIVVFTMSYYAYHLEGPYEFKKL